MKVCMKEPLVLVEWFDSKGITEGWEFREDLESLPPARCCSVGFLLEDGHDHKTLAMTISDTQILGRLTIPAGAVIKLKRLK